MSLEFKITIAQASKANAGDFPGAITNLVCKLTTKDLLSDVESVILFAIKLPDPDPAAFIPWDNLTEETVVSWVEELLGKTVLPKIKESALQEIREKNNNCELVSVFPWSDPEEDY
jgi:hypothetical protein